MADVNFAGINTPLGRFLTTTGFGSVQNLVGLRQTPVLGYSGLIAAATAIGGGGATGILATFNDAADPAGAGTGANTQEILNQPAQWRGYVLGLEVNFPGDLAMANIDDYISNCYIRVTCGGIDTDTPLSQCIRLNSEGVVAGGGFYIRNPYFFSAPLFWPGDGSEVVRVMALDGIAGAVALQMSLSLHVALGRSQDNSTVQPGFGGPTNCSSGDEFMASTQNAAMLRRSFTG